jgi:hypothetical protein
MYACAIFSNDNTKLARALHINEPNDAPRADRAVGSTNVKISYQLYESDTLRNGDAGSNLDYHAQELLKRLQLGLPLKMALDDLQDDVRGAGYRVRMKTESDPQSSCEMFTTGNDPWARLAFVYLNESEWNSFNQNPSGRNTWYYKLP